MCVRLLLTVRSHSFVISALPQFSTSDSGSIFRGRIPSTEKAITISVLGKRSLMLSIMPWRKFFSTALNLVVMKKLNTCKYGKIAYGPNGPNWGWYNGPFWKPMGKWPEIPSQPHPWLLYSRVHNKRGWRIKGVPRTNQKISLTGGSGINGTLRQISCCQ